jgi:hypothetical protein
LRGKIMAQTRGLSIRMLPRGWRVEAMLPLKRGGGEV